MISEKFDGSDTITEGVFADPDSITERCDCTDTINKEVAEPDSITERFDGSDSITETFDGSDSITEEVAGTDSVTEGFDGSELDTLTEKFLADFDPWEFSLT